MDPKDKQEAPPESARDDEEQSGSEQGGDDAAEETEAEAGEERDDPEPSSRRSERPASGWARAVAFFNEHYRSADPRWLGLFRICFGLLLISELMYRWAYARELFSNDGLLPNHFSLFAPMGQDLFSIYHVFSTVEEVHVAFALTFVVFACFTLGYKTRLFHILSAFLITSLHSRNLFVENGGSVVKDGFAEFMEKATAQNNAEQFAGEDGEVARRIKDLIDTYVKPGVEMDGGNIEFKSYDNGRVHVIMQGSCSGCPSSTVTLKAGIEGMLKRMVPEVTEVVQEME